MDKEEYGIELNLLIDKFKNKMAQVQNYFKNFSSNVKDEIQVGVNISKAQERIKKLEEEIEHYNKIIDAMKRKNIGAESIKPFQDKIAKAEEEIQNKINAMSKLDKTPMTVLSTFFTNLKNIFKKTEESTEEIKDDVEEIGEKGQTAGNNLGNAFTRGAKSLKKFALSLFGIQSIWRVLSRASSAYMQQNKELSSKIQGVWNALGTLIGPVIDALANVFMKLLGYINVVTKALFNFDFIAKANANTLKNYQKQANKTSKALAGIDELQNLNQQTSQDEGPQGLLEVPELDSKIVKFLQDMAKALKDNWDWISKVLIGLGAVFGVKAVAGWVSGIGSLIGGAGVGLLGLAGALILVYDIIKLQDLSKQWNELKEYRKELEKTNDKIHKGYMKNLEDKKEEAKSYEKGSQKLAQYTGMLRSNIEMNLADMESHDKKSKAYKRAEEELKANIKAYSELYKQGLLSNEQAKTYTKTLLALGYSANGTKLKTEEYRLVLQQLGVSEKDINDIINDNINKEHLQKEAIKGTTKEMSLSKEEAEKMGNTFAELAKKPFEILFKTKVEKPDLSEVQNMINGIFGKLGVKAENGWVSAFGTKLFKIPGFAVGTDLVKSDGLAYIHAGEQIVPADAVKGGYTGGNNEKTNDLLRELIDTVESKQFNASISSDDVGRASVNYIRNQNRLMGGSVI